MKKTILIILLGFLALGIYSCSDSTVNPVQNNLVLKSGNYWIYSVTDSLNNTYLEKDVIEALMYKVIHGVSKPVFQIHTYRNDNLVNTWYLYQDTNSFWVASDNSLVPLVNYFNTWKSNFWTRFSFNNPKTFSTSSDSLIEAFTVMNQQGMPVNGKIEHSYRFDCQYMGVYNDNTNSDFNSSNKFDCVFQSKEILIEPMDVVFTNGTRVRNQIEINLTIIYSPKIGFIKFEQSNYKRELKEYHFN